MSCGVEKVICLESAADFFMAEDMVSKAEEARKSLKCRGTLNFFLLTNIDLALSVDFSGLDKVDRVNQVLGVQDPKEALQVRIKANGPRSCGCWELFTQNGFGGKTLTLRSGEVKTIARNSQIKSFRMVPCS